MWKSSLPPAATLVLTLVVTLAHCVAVPPPTTGTRLGVGTPADEHCDKTEFGQHLNLPVHAARAPRMNGFPRCHSHLQVGQHRHSDGFGSKQTYGFNNGLSVGDAEPHLYGMLLMVSAALGEVAAQDFNPFPFVEITPGSVPHIWGRDVFPERRHTHPSDGDEGLSFFKAAPAREWLILAVTCIALCFLDVLVLQRMPNTFRVHLTCIGLWLGVALFFNMLIWSRMGHRKALEWCAGYVLEWMLSMDNLFVFHLIFQAYQTPPDQVHKAVFVGVFGAIAMRMAFFMLVSTLLHAFHWIRIPFGLLLIWSGIQAAKGGDDDVDVKDMALIRGLKWCLGPWLSEHYDEHGCALFVWHNGRCQATLLFIVVACLEFTDIVFALDSVSAKVAQIPDQYIAFSSSVIAMFGLRAMFFVMQDLVQMFDLLQYGLCIILVFIGAELLFSQYIHMAASSVCILILSVFICCIAGSVAKNHLAAKPQSPTRR